MINTWNESLLHEELKEYYRGEYGRTEVPLEGSICDVLREDGSVIEIQTANLGKLKKKLEKLLKNYRVTLVYPIAKNTFIETFTEDGTLKSKRKSPKHNTEYRLFNEITGIWTLIGHPNFAIQTIHADILEIRIADGTGSWRRKGIRIDDRKLIRIHGVKDFSSKESYAALIPVTLPEIFTVADLMQAGAGKYAGKMVWVLRKAGILELYGKRGNAYEYRRK